jgi:hypothetical protein
LRHTLHITAAALLWVVFVYYWRIVLRRPMNPDTRTALITLSILTAASIVFLAVWVFHNVRTYRALDRRKVRRSVTLEPHRDFLGRRLVMDPSAALKRSHYIDVEFERDLVSGDPRGRKVFKTRTTSGVRF